MEVDYSRQPGLEPIGPQDGQLPESIPKHEHDQNLHEGQEGHYYAPGWNAASADPAKPERRLCGLRPITFGLVVAIVLLVIAAAVGGGVGGSLAVKHAKDDARASASKSAAAAIASATANANSTNTTSGLNYAVTTLAWGPVISSPLPYSGCPKSNDTIYSSINGPQNWRLYCDFDMPGNDLIQTNTPNIELCIETCANWNTVFNSDSQCKGVAFVPKYIVTGQPPSDCYLKSNASVSLLTNTTKRGFEFVSAILQST